jgi:hypothetical protein
MSEQEEKLDRVMSRQEEARYDQYLTKNYGNSYRYADPLAERDRREQFLKAEEQRYEYYLAEAYGNSHRYADPLAEQARREHFFKFEYAEQARREQLQFLQPMADQKEQGNTGRAGGKEVTAEDRYVKDVLWQRKVIMDALRGGTLACLPNERGYADTQPAVNLINNSTYNGSTLLYLKEIQRQRGYPSAEYVTMEQIGKAEESLGKNVHIAAGERGINIPYKEQNKATGEWMPKHQTLYNVAQISNPETIREYAEGVRREKEERGRAWAEQNGKTLRNPWHETEIECTSSDPEKYLGQYITAMSFGARFKVSRTRAAEFADKTEEKIYEPSQTGKPNPMNLLKLSSRANEYAKTFRNEVIEGRVAANRERQRQKEDAGLGY